MKPLILITNDDGVYSPGLLAAAEAVKDLGDLLIAAPVKQQTGIGRGFPRTPDMGIIEEAELTVGNEKVKAYGVHGSPAYAVAHAVLELAPRKPDLCIAGINYGENVGLVLTCSGTVGAVLEADSHGIPGIALSVQADVKLHRTLDYPEHDWRTAKAVTRFWTKKVLEKGIPKGASMLNINIPDGLEDPAAYRFTRQERQNYFVLLKPERKSFEKPFELKCRLDVDVESLDKGSDIQAVYVDKITSVTPLGWDLSVPAPEDY